MTNPTKEVSQEIDTLSQKRDTLKAKFDAVSESSNRLNLVSSSAKDTTFELSDIEALSRANIQQAEIKTGCEQVLILFEQGMSQSSMRDSLLSFLCQSVCSQNRLLIRR